MKTPLYFVLVMMLTSASLSLAQPKTNSRQLFGLKGNVRKTVITSKSDATIFGRASTFQADVEVKEFGDLGELSQIRRYVFNAQDTLELFQSEQYTFSNGLMTTAETLSSKGVRVALHEFSNHDSEGRPTEMKSSFADKTEKTLYKYAGRKILKTLTSTAVAGKVEFKTYLRKDGQISKEIIRSFDNDGLTTFERHKYKYLDSDKVGNWTKRTIRQKTSSNKAIEERELFYD